MRQKYYNRLLMSDFQLKSLFSFPFLLTKEKNMFSWPTIDFAVNYMIFLDYLFIFPLLFYHFWFSLFFNIMLIYETSARFSFHFSASFFFPRYIWVWMVITKRKYFYFILLHTFSFFLVSLSPYRYTCSSFFLFFFLSPLLLLLPSFIFQDENNFLTYNHCMLFKGYFYFDNYEWFGNSFILFWAQITENRREDRFFLFYLFIWFIFKHLFMIVLFFLISFFSFFLACFFYHSNFITSPYILFYL